MTNSVEARPTQRMAQVKAPILKDDVLYRPGSDRSWVPVDAETYLELLSIDGIAPGPWESLELEPKGGLPAVQPLEA